jgi:multiple sugar transport system ATP-binding protein
MTMGQRICIMKDGEIVQVGAPLDVYRNPVNTFVAGFLASPPMNLLAGHLDSAKSGPEAVCGTVRLKVPKAFRDTLASHSGKPVTLGLRPEDFQLPPGGLPVDVSTVALEALGPEVILVCELGGQGGPEIMVRMPRDFTAKPGEALTLHYDTSQLHVFNAASGQSLLQTHRR